MTSYKTFLRAIGRKPIPSHDKLRTSHKAKPGDKLLDTYRQAVTL